MQTIFNKDVRKKFYLQKFYLNTQKNFIQMISEFCCNIIFFTFSSNHLHKKYLKWGVLSCFLFWDIILVFSRDHCQRFSLLRISDTPQAGSPTHHNPAWLLRWFLLQVYSGADYSWRPLVISVCHLSSLVQV